MASTDKNQTPEEAIAARIASDRQRELDLQESVRQQVWDATHNKDGSPKPIPTTILP